MKKRNAELLTLALDRIVRLEECSRPYIPKRKDFNLTDYLNNVVGVSVSPGSKVEKVVLFADKTTAPYIITKPIHHTQQVEEILPHGAVISFHVQLNFELEREILGFGERVRVIAPERLKRRIKSCIESALDQYQNELSQSSLQSLIQKLIHKGSAILHYVYSKKEVNQIKSYIEHYFKTRNITSRHACRNVLEEIPEIKSLVLNANLLHIINKINPQLFLTKAIYFDKTPGSNWYVTWHQDTTINVKEKIETEGYKGWTSKSGVFGACPPEDFLKDTLTIRIHIDDADESNGALKIIPGSHNKKLTDEEIDLITQNSIPYVCNVPACGIHIMKPLLVHASSKATGQKSRRVIHLEFNSMELPNGLEWAERLEIVN